MQQTISIIIPVINEAENLSFLLPYLQQHGGETVTEIIVVDGGSTDDTHEVVHQQGATLLHCKERSRAAQQNMGAKHSTGSILYFVHADTIPPTTFVEDILQACKEGQCSGCYRFKFRSNKWLLRVNSYFTRFDRIMCRGGDQTLFIKRELFEKLNGFNPYYVIMEEYDLIKRIKPHGFKIIPKDALVSARKYNENSYFRVNLANFVVFMLYFANVNPLRLKTVYGKMIAHPKG